MKANIGKLMLLKYIGVKFQKHEKFFYYKFIAQFFLHISNELTLKILTPYIFVSERQETFDIRGSFEHRFRLMLNINASKARWN